MLFFGVPNLGLRNEQLITLVRGQPNQSLIYDLLVDRDSEPSNFLKKLGDEFSRCCKGRYRVVTFFERMLSPTLEVRYFTVKTTNINANYYLTGQKWEIEKDGPLNFIGYREICYQYRLGCRSR